MMQLDNLGSKPKYRLYCVEIVCICSRKNTHNQVT